MTKRLIIPCLKGHMGTWTTYSCMMRMVDVAQLVGFAHELHTIKELSDKIQRELNENRTEDIAKYLIQNEDRFFNSLVVAVYDGDPNWHDIGNIKPNSNELGLLEFPEYIENCIGFLSITKKERFFALDGQHRLAGIKTALSKNEDLANELISVVIVAHKNTPEGKIRSRRLFTTLNKKAKLVSKDAIISLDEDDISACITRKLIESSSFPYFNNNNISFNTGAVRDKTSITTIVNLYDNIQKIVAAILKVEISDLEKFNYKDYSYIYNHIKEFFAVTFENNEALRNIHLNQALIPKYRNSDDGGELLLRPIGWDLYTDLFTHAYKQDIYDAKSIIINMNKLNMNLSGPLLANKIWSTKRSKITRLSARNYNDIQSKVMKFIAINIAKT